jgi:membrane protein
VRILHELIQSVRRLLTTPREELGRAQRSLRFALNLARHCARELARDRAAQMAAALTYRTLFSLIPVVVLSLLVFRALGGLEDLRPALQEKVYTFMGLQAVAEPAPAGDEEPGEEPAGSMETELRRRIGETVGQVADRAATLDFRSVGVIGAIVLFWGAFALLATVEHCFNRIYKCPSGRSWGRRLTTYWALLTLGPLLLLVSLYLAEHLLSWLQRSSIPGGLLATAIRLAPLAASWLLLFIAYVWVPNTRVRRRSAMVGALVAAILWELGKWAFQLYLARVVPNSLLYGTLGIIPLFLLWIHLTWLAVLFGLELSYTLQAMQLSSFEEIEASEGASRLTDPRWVVPVMARAARAFAEGEPVREEQLAGELTLPQPGVRRILETLADSGLVHRLRQRGGDDDAYVLARPPASIPLAELVRVIDSAAGARPGAAAGPGWALLDGLTEAQSASVGEATLATLLEGDGDAPAGS